MEIITTLIASISTGGFLVWLIKLIYLYLMRKQPKSTRQKYDEKGRLLENEITYR